MFPALQFAMLALGAASGPSNLANDLATAVPAASGRLVTVEAATSRATHATARAWARVDGCWTKAGGPYTRLRDLSPRSDRQGDERLRPPAPPSLVHLLRWFDPDALPQIAIGTTGSLRQARRS